MTETRYKIIHKRFAVYNFASATAAILWMFERGYTDVATWDWSAQ